MEYEDNYSSLLNETLTKYFNFFNKITLNKFLFNYSFLQKVLCMLLWDELQGKQHKSKIVCNEVMKLPVTLNYFDDFETIFKLKFIKFKRNKFSSCMTFSDSTDTAVSFLLKQKNFKALVNRIYPKEKITVTFDPNTNFQYENEFKKMLKEDFSEENLSYIDDMLEFSFAKYVLWKSLFYFNQRKSKKIDLMGAKVFLPRPFSDESLNFRTIAANFSEEWIGHNSSYIELYEGDSKERYNQLKRLLDNNNLKVPHEIPINISNKVLNKLGKKILIPLFPYGDYGYPEYECNDHYQKKIIVDLLNFFENKDCDIFLSPHPGTTDLKFLKNLKDKFPNSNTRSFDNFLNNSDSVICTYRSTSCLGSALNFGKFCLLLKNKNYTNNKNYQNLKIINRYNMNSISEFL